MSHLRSDNGVTTIHFPDGSQKLAKGHDATVYHGDIVEV
jgi:hypothetical protein